MAQFDEGNRLNSAYWHGGCEYLEQCIEDYFGIQIDRYARVNFYSFIDIVETVGGIDMEVSKAEAEGMKKPMAEQNKYLKNKKGTDYISDDIFAGKSDEDKVKLHLNGNQALAFARLRYVGNSDYERTERYPERQGSQKCFSYVCPFYIAYIPLCLRCESLTV